MDQNNFNAGAPRPFRSHSHTSNHNNHNSAHSGHQTPMRHSLPTCMALVDARYVGWLSGKPNGLMNRSAFASVLAQALPNAGVHAQLVRTYWYTESDDCMLVDYQCVRLVANDLHNEGGPTLSAMVRDLNALAQCGGCVHVVIASDDERLIAAIDEARLSGMRVHTLCDESVQNFAMFSKNEPDLARLVRAGDRRIIVARGELTQGRVPVRVKRAQIPWHLLSTPAKPCKRWRRLGGISAIAMSGMTCAKRSPMRVVYRKTLTAPCSVRGAMSLTAH